MNLLCYTELSTQRIVVISSTKCIYLQINLQPNTIPNWLALYTYKNAQYNNYCYKYTLKMYIYKYTLIFINIKISIFSNTHLNRYAHTNISFSFHNQVCKVAERHNNNYSLIKCSQLSKLFQLTPFRNWADLLRQAAA